MLCPKIGSHTDDDIYKDRNKDQHTNIEIDRLSVFSYLISVIGQTYSPSNER